MTPAVPEGDYEVSVKVNFLEHEFFRSPADPSEAKASYRLPEPLEVDAFSEDSPKRIGTSGVQVIGRE